MYHLDIQIYEDSLDDDHVHEHDHIGVVSTYGYVTGIHYYYFNPICRDRLLHI